MKIKHFWLGAILAATTSCEKTNSSTSYSERVSVHRLNHGFMIKLDGDDLFRFVEFPDHSKFFIYPQEGNGNSLIQGSVIDSSVLFLRWDVADSDQGKVWSWTSEDGVIVEPRVK